MTEADTPARQVRFCVTPAGVRVAYATLGRVPALLVPAAWISHLELLWQDPAVRAFFTPLADGSCTWPPGSRMRGWYHSGAGATSHLRPDRRLVGR